MALRWRARRRRLTAERVEGGLRGFGAVRYTLCSCDFLRVVFLEEGWWEGGGVCSMIPDTTFMIDMFE
jgi:hypothetical protein